MEWLHFASLCAAVKLKEKDGEWDEGREGWVIITTSYLISRG